VMYAGQIEFFSLEEVGALITEGTKRKFCEELQWLFGLLPVVNGFAKALDAFLPSSPCLT
jgi:hypothetical protein